jgi:hypothetical protein
MATYSFKIKKGKYELNLSTSDKELLVEQFELWVKQATEYAQKRKAKECKELVKTQIKEEEEITKKNIETHIANKPKSEEPILEDRPIKEKANNNKVVFENPKKEKDLDIFYAPPTSDSISSITNKITSGGVFDNILENSLNNPQTELTFRTSPSIHKDTAFINYMGSRKIERKIDYLLLTAYYFTQYEQKPRFTLKQLNAKLMQNLAVILDHSVLQEAINRDYIECLPDLTGLVGSSEYRLTAYGEKVLLDE